MIKQNIELLNTLIKHADEVMKNMVKQRIPTPSRSKELINSIKGNKIVAFHRELSWGIDKIQSYFSIPDNRTFESGGGVFCLGLDNGNTLCISDHSSNNSVVVWQQKEPETEFELKIDCTDERYSTGAWSGIIGSSIIGFSILVEQRQDGRFKHRDNEVGLIFVLDNGVELLFFLRLSDPSLHHLVLSEAGDDLNMSGKNVELLEY